MSRTSSSPSFAVNYSDRVVRELTVPDLGKGPASLRFAPGEIVWFLFTYHNIYATNRAEREWIPGQIHFVCRREKFANSTEVQYPVTDEADIAKKVWGERRFIPYVVRPVQANGIRQKMRINWESYLCLYHDTSEYVRPRQDDRPTPMKLTPFQVEPLDRQASRYHPNLSANHSRVAKEWWMMYRLHPNPGGPTRLRAFNIDSLSGFFDRDHSMWSVLPLGLYWLARSPPHFPQHTRTTLAQLVYANLPQMEEELMRDDEHRILSYLERKARSSSEGMIQLGDALEFGLFGIPQNPSRALRCYKAAAYGSKEETPGSYIHCVGLPLGGCPRGMVAYGYALLSRLANNVCPSEDMAPEIRRFDGVAFRTAFEYDVQASNDLEESDYEPSLPTILFHTCESLRRGHLSLFALEVARVLTESTIVHDYFIKSNFVEEMKLLREALDYQNLWLEYRDLQQRGALPMGDPSALTMELFRKRIPQIYRKLPESDKTIHIECRTFPADPNPHFFLVSVPAENRLLRVILLPDVLQCMPYSNETFEYVWERIVFLLHIGSPLNFRRLRPALFTVKECGNSAGGLVSFLRKVQGITPVDIIRGDEHIQVVCIKNGETFSTNVDRVTSSLVNTICTSPGHFLGIPSSGVVLTSFFQKLKMIQRPILQELEFMVENELIMKVETLKAKANEAFQGGMFEEALPYYLAGINVLKTVKFFSIHTERRKRVLELLGTLLSNSAMCALNLEARHSDENFRDFLCKLAIRNSSVVWSSGIISEAVRKTIRNKVSFRIDKAHSRYDALMKKLPRSTAPPDEPEPVIRPVSDNYEAENISPAIDNGVERDYPLNATATAPTDQPRVQKRKKQRKKRHNKRNHRDSDSSEIDIDAGDDLDNIDSKPPAVQSFESINSNVESSDEDMYTDGDWGIICPGINIFETKLAKNYDDECVCAGDFQGELAHKYCTILPDPCEGHAFCVECICEIKIQADKAKEPPRCSHCRNPIDPEFFENLCHNIALTDPVIKDLMQREPFCRFEERDSIVQTLMWRNKFKVEKVIDLLENMADGEVKDQYFRAQGDLSSREKDAIYRKARAPVERLIEKKNLLEEEYRTTVANVKRCQEIRAEVYKLERQITVARRKAREDIYLQTNSAGTMGAEDTVSGTIKVDFHGLSLKDMQTTFDEQVKPILPAVGKITIITGRGLHSDGGEAKLKKALMKRINQKENDIRYELIEGNAGALNVLWSPREQN